MICHRPRGIRLNHIILTPIQPALQLASISDTWQAAAINANPNEFGPWTPSQSWSGHLTHYPAMIMLYMCLTCRMPLGLYHPHSWNGHATASRRHAINRLRLELWAEYRSRNSRERYRFVGMRSVDSSEMMRVHGSTRQGDKCYRYDRWQHIIRP